jgi:hypothetical protein
MFAWSSISQIELPSTLQRIGNHAFWNTKLHDVTIPASCTYIDEYAFTTTSNMQITFEESSLDLTICSKAFAYSDGQTVIINGDRNITMGSYAFAYCTNSYTAISAKNIVIKDLNNGNYISLYTFAYCENTQITLTVENSFTINGYYAFARCNEVTFNIEVNGLDVGVSSAVLNLGGETFNSSKNITVNFINLSEENIQIYLNQNYFKNATGVVNCNDNTYCISKFNQ